MRFEDTIQYMYDFFPDLFYNRQKCLDHLFCVIGNGYEWVNGELISWQEGFLNRWQLVKSIEKAQPNYSCKVNEQLKETEIKVLKIRGASDKVIGTKWYPISSHSAINNIPEDITKDWLAGVNECKELLRLDNVNYKLD